MTTTEELIAILTTSITAMRKIAIPVGPMHAYWDSIVAAEKLLSQLKNPHMDSQTKVAPVGTENLPMEDRIRVYIEVFESGCSNTQIDGVPEDCPECVRAFVNAVKKAVNFRNI